LMCTPEKFRVQIRNRNSPKAVKPRVFDALVEGSTVYLEVKDKKSCEVVALDDVLLQIAQAKQQQQNTKTTEP